MTAPKQNSTYRDRTASRFSRGSVRPQTSAASLAKNSTCTTAAAAQQSSLSARNSSDRTKQPESSFDGIEKLQLGHKT